MNIESFIPIDKSHCIRMALLDLFRLDKDSSEKFDNENLGSDLVSLKYAISDWLAGNPIRVGESGTLYRFLKFAAWKQNLESQRHSLPRRVFNRLDRGRGLLSLVFAW